jgi:hypothetical protein
MLEALSKAELEKGNRRAGKRDGHVDICRKLTTDISPVHSHATVDCRRLQTVQAAVPKRLLVLVFPEDWIVTCDPIQSRVRIGPNGLYGTLVYGRPWVSKSRCTDGQ